MMSIFGSLTTLDIMVFVQVMLEVLPVSSSAQVKLAQLFCSKYLKKPMFLNSCHSRIGHDCVELSNIISDAVLLLVYRKRVFRLFEVDQTVRFFGVVKFIFLAGLANFVTMVFYFLKSFCPCFIFSYKLMLKTFPIAFFVLFSLYFKDKYFPTIKPVGINFSRALVLGTVQSLALLPGVSRLGITYAASRWLDLSEKQALLFSYVMHGQIALLFLVKFLFTHDLSLCKELFSLHGVVLIIIGALASYPLFLLTYNLAIKKKFYYFAAVYLPSIALLIWLLLQ